MLKIQPLPVGPLEVNCYLIWNSAGGAGIVVDPGDDARRIATLVDRKGVRPLAIFLTHGHVDHIRGVGEVAKHFAIPVVLDDADRPLYFSPDNALPPWLPKAEGLPEPTAAPSLDKLAGLSILSTPGHTPGGRCFHFPSEKMVFTGDTLFSGSIGRTDLPGGDSGQLLDSIRRHLLPLPPETAVYPGHGPPTTIADERKSNPFLLAERV